MKEPFTDGEILDWLEAKMPQPHLRMHLSDARDMGYTNNFISFGVEDSPTGKGNSVREAMSAAMRADNGRVPTVKPPVACGDMEMMLRRLVRAVESGSTSKAMRRAAQAADLLKRKGTKNTFLRQAVAVPAGKKPLWAKCSGCAHCWPAAYYPIGVAEICDALNAAACPNGCKNEVVLAKQNEGELLEPADTSPIKGKPADHSHEAIPLALMPGQKPEANCWIMVRTNRGNEYGRKSADTGYTLWTPPVGVWMQKCRWADDESDIVGVGQVVQFTQKILDRINRG